MNDLRIISKFHKKLFKNVIHPTLTLLDCFNFIASNILIYY